MQSIEVLKKSFPQCFFARGKEKPLKVGIHRDLIAAMEAQTKAQHKPALTRTQCRMALQAYTQRDSYRMALRLHNTRVDLQGNVSGRVDALSRVKAFKALVGLEATA